MDGYRQAGWGMGSTGPGANAGVDSKWDGRYACMFAIGLIERGPDLTRMVLPGSDMMTLCALMNHDRL